MIATHPLDSLALAHVRGDELRAQAAAERLPGASARRHAVAESLRRAANRLDATPLARTAASQS